MGMDKSLEKEKDRKAAKDFVNLTHVETHKQKVDKEALAKVLNFQAEKSTQSAAPSILTADDRVILGSFLKKRMQLDRIWITFNQTRSQMGQEPMKRVELKVRLDELVKLGYMTWEEIEYDNQKSDVYILTEKGEAENQ